MTNKNIIVGQSGGPTSVINSSIAGIYRAAIQTGAKKVFGMSHGVAGLLKDELVDLNSVLNNDLKISLLERTPSSFLGSCRYKLKSYEEDDTEYKTIFKLLQKHEIGYFFYIGGNDSMDTIAKLADYGKAINSDIRFIGVPKTIDNDLAVTDHCPGFGSAAKYVSTVMKEIALDAAAYGTPYVTIVEIMGRNTGWLTASAALSKSENSDGVDLFCLPETPFDVDAFLSKVAELQSKKTSILVAVSEGIKAADGRYVCELAYSSRAVDAFGHKNLTGTSRFLTGLCDAHLKTKTRSIELSTLQRCAGHVTSQTDITEAYQVGGAAVLAAMAGRTGETIILKRISDNPYQCTTDCVPTSELANYEKMVPVNWIAKDHTDMSKEFLDYARPLIQGELTPFYVEGLPYHIRLGKDI